MISRLKNNFGFSMIEGLVAVALGMGLLIAVSDLYLWIKQSQEDISSASEIELLNNEIGRFIKDGRRCTDAFIGKNFDVDPLILPDLKDAGGVKIYEVGRVVGPKQIVITELSLNGFVVLDTLGTSQRGLSKLTVQYQYKKSKDGELKYVTEQIPVLIARDTGGLRTIRSCGDVPVDYWLRAGANIYSTVPAAAATTPHVGIGTLAPAAPLEVTTFPVTIGDQSVGGDRLIFDSPSAGVKRIYSTNGASISFNGLNGMVIDNNRMGVGADKPISAHLEIGEVGGTRSGFEFNSGHGEIWMLKPALGGEELSFERRTGGGAGGSNAVILTSVGVKGLVPGGYRFYVNGSAGGTVAWNTPSDIRLKENIKKIDKALALVGKLRPVTYVLKDSAQRGQQIGFIAQEVAQVLPQLVHKFGDFYSVKLDQMTALLVEAIHELEHEISKQEQELDLFVRDLCEENPRDELCQD